jgi:hypothetical protein
MPPLGNRIDPRICYVAAGLSFCFCG